jgi:hypothetical protein
LLRRAKVEVVQQLKNLVSWWPDNTGEERPKL